jgi:hypothetical protein
MYRECRNVQHIRSVLIARKCTSGVTADSHIRRSLLASIVTFVVLRRGASGMGRLALLAYLFLATASHGVFFDNCFLRDNRYRLHIGRLWQIG